MPLQRCKIRCVYKTPFRIPEVPTGAAGNEIHQIIGEKIRSLEHDPANMQVITKGEGNNSDLYLVDDTSVINVQLMRTWDDNVGSGEQDPG